MEIEYSYQQNCINAFNALCKRYEGRKAEIQVQKNNISQNVCSVPIRLSRSQARPLTLSQFEHNFRTRFPHNKPSYQPPVVSSSKLYNSNRQITKYQTNQIAKQNQISSTRKSSPASASITERNAHYQRRCASVNYSCPVAQGASSPLATRRIIVNNAQKHNPTQNKVIGFIDNVRRIPFTAIATIIICALSLIFIVSASVVISDSKTKYQEVQEDFLELSILEQELELQLQTKNDLRQIEEMATNELGMVKKDLVTREYINLANESTIEIYEEDDRNIGISALLSAIIGGS